MMEVGDYKRLTVEQYSRLSIALVRLFFKVTEDSLRYMVKTTLLEYELPRDRLRVTIAKQTFNLLVAECIDIEALLFMTELRKADIYDAIATYIENRFDIW